MAIGAAIVMGLLTVVDPHVRSDVPDLRALVADGAERSATFSSLVDRLNDSDLVVYVEYAYWWSEHVDGCVTFISAAGGRRYVRVRIRWPLPRPRQLAMLGHELQHAVEIAGAPDVVDQASLARFYRRGGSGTDWNFGRGVRFDTHDAVVTGLRVVKELGVRLTITKAKRSNALGALHNRHPVVEASPAGGIR